MSSTRFLPGARPFGAGAQAAVGDGVHVPEDDVGLEPRLEHRVRAAVHAHDERTELAHVRAQHREVLLVVVATDDDEDVPPLEDGPDLRHPDAVDDEVALALDVLHRVLGECLELAGQAQAGPLGRLGDRLGVLDDARGDELGAVVDGAVRVDLDLVAVGQLHEVGAHVVYERDAGGDDDAGAGVRVAAGRRLGGVEDRGRPRGDERLRRDPVDVDVVDDRDVPGAQAAGQALGPDVHTGRADDQPGVL
jgi:hypothetical protein